MKDSIKVKKARKKFVEFTKNLWVQEITEEETGSLLNEKLHEVFELDKLYHQVKYKYDILYKELNFEKERKTLIWRHLHLSFQIKTKKNGWTNIYRLKCRTPRDLFYKN